MRLLCLWQRRHLVLICYLLGRQEWERKRAYRNSNWSSDTRHWYQRSSVNYVPAIATKRTSEGNQKRRLVNKRSANQNFVNACGNTMLNIAYFLSMYSNSHLTSRRFFSPASGMKQLSRWAGIGTKIRFFMTIVQVSTDPPPDTELTGNIVWMS